MEINLPFPRLRYANRGYENYSYQYDPGDNLINQVKPDGTQAFIVNNLNQVALINDTQVVGHDVAGNQLGDGIRTYVWDADHRLLAIYYDAEPNRSTLFKYDGLGRRVGIISKNGTSVTEVRLLWCGDRICQARNGSDTVTRLYYPEGEVRGSALLYYSRDHLGSVRDVSTVHNGARIASFDYDAYGKTTRSTGRLSPDFRYAGMYYLQEADLYLTQYRVYDPRTARWLSRDPIAEDGGVNLYAYVEGNPQNYIDPQGLFALPLAIPLGQALVDAAAVALGGAMIADSLTSDNNPPPIPEISPSAAPTTGTGTRQWDKLGNADDANNDFDNYPDITGIENKGNGVRVGTLPNGDRIIVRPNSSTGKPTIEIQRPDGRRSKDKIRYCP